METQIYFPPPESKGGWHWLKDPDEVRELAGMDPEVLDLMAKQQEFLWGSESWSIVIIRHGFLVREYYSFNVLIPTRFDIWSGTKSFTGTAWGILLEDSRQGKLPSNKQVDLDSLIFSFIPEAYPLTDPRKERMTVRHLLTLTSALPGGVEGVWGVPTATEHGPFEHALGRHPNRYSKWVDKLVGEPGGVWRYSDPGWLLLSLAFYNITGREMSDFLQERVFDPIGIENLSWDVQGGSGFMGPHTNAHTGIHVSGRELVRFGYLMLKKGVWNGEQLVPEWWIDLATKPSQDLNPAYGYTWWVGNPNTGGPWPGGYQGTFALSGHRTNYCCIYPALDLVVARVGSGPSLPEYSALNAIVEAVIE